MAAKDDKNKEQKEILGKEIRKTAKAKVIHTYIRVAGVRKAMRQRESKAKYQKDWSEKNKKKGKGE